MSSQCSKKLECFFDSFFLTADKHLCICGKKSKNQKKVVPLRFQNN